MGMAEKLKHMDDKKNIEELRKAIDVVQTSCTPLERCWALRNYIGTMTNRYDVADEIAAAICDLIIPYQPNDKMVNNEDDDCTEYWQKTKEYLISGR